jgi:formate hydrogenlyase subunit 6/NADH:ubiquinone oxidoreductase subunit I
VGAHDDPQCMDVCPADCIIPDPAHTENHEQLQAKYDRLHA